jgi:hypothetical protein
LVKSLLEDGRHFAGDKARYGEVSVGWTEIDAIATERRDLTADGRDVAARRLSLESGFRHNSDIGQRRGADRSDQISGNLGISNFHDILAMLILTP